MELHSGYSDTPPPPLAVPPEERPKIVRNREITGWRIKMFYMTRDLHLLFWLAVVIVGLGMFIGSRAVPKPGAPMDIEEGDSFEVRVADDEASMDAGLAKELAKAKPDLGRVLVGLSESNSYELAAVTEMYGRLAQSGLTPAEKQVANAHWASLASHLGAPGADLLYLAYYVTPPAYANELVGDYYAGKPRKFQRAIERYERELSVRPEAESPRRKILSLCWSKQDIAKLAVLRGDPLYGKLFTTKMDLSLSMRRHDWARVWPPLLMLYKESYVAATPLILTALAGGLWLLLAWQMIQAPSLLSFRTLISIPALLMGALSTLPVLFLDMYQSEAWGLKQHGLFFYDLWFFVAGVGLREELCKLIAFLPFVPILIKRQNRLEMLVIASCVGLGFAVEENVSYFHGAPPSLAFQRFLTANFFHFAATGLIGLAFCDAVRNPQQKSLRFVLVFLCVVIVHGLYDTFASAPKFTDGWNGSIFPALLTACLILLALAYFRLLAKERGPATDQFFPGATLVLGISVLMSVITVLSSQVYGFTFALSMMLIAGIQGLLFTRVFFVLLRDGLREEEQLPDPAPIY